MGDNLIRILHIEDNAADARLVKEIFADAVSRAGSASWALRQVTQLRQALEALQADRFDIVLADLSLPDAQGLDSIKQLRTVAPQVAIVVMTGLADETLAAQSIQEGAQDYLLKNEVTGGLLLRAIRYAVERQRLQEELAQARQREQQQRELESLGRLSGSTSTAVTAQLYDMAPLSRAAPERFGEWVRRYGDLIEHALEQRAFKVQYNIGEDLRGLAEELGFLQAGPRDVVQIHVRALNDKTREAAHARVLACTEEGRLMVLELMGYLADYYRHHAFGASPAVAPKKKE